MRQLESGYIDFGLIQQGVVVSSSIKAVAPVYEDVVHILVRKEAGIEGLADLKGRSVSLGTEASGSWIVSQRLLSHYGLTLEDVDNQVLSPRESTEALVAGKLDAIILVTAMRAPIIVGALSSGKVRHLSLGQVGDENSEAHGISSKLIDLKVTTIAKHSYSKGANTGGKYGFGDSRAACLGASDSFAIDVPR